MSEEEKKIKSIKKRYFFVSDIHGHYTELLKALKDSNFNREKDTIVSVGDPFDRGTKNIDVLKFLLSCPNRILIMGNHDYRLFEMLLFYDLPSDIDRHNGTADTLLEFGEITNSKDFDEDIYHTAICNLRYEKSPNALLLRQYFSEVCCGIDFNDFTCVHAWLPRGNYTIATEGQWFDAISSNVEYCLKNRANYPDKDLIIGHWGTYRLRIFFNPIIFRRENCHDIFTHTFYHRTGDPLFTLTALDGTVAWDPKTEEERQILPAGKINILVKELDETPKKLYPFGADGYFRRLAYTY